MQLLHFSPTEIGHVFELVAAVLHLGNVRFRTTGDRECDIENEATSLWYAHALGKRSVTNLGNFCNNRSFVSKRETRYSGRVSAILLTAFVKKYSRLRLSLTQSCTPFL